MSIYSLDALIAVEFLFSRWLDARLKELFETRSHKIRGYGWPHQSLYDNTEAECHEDFKMVGGGCAVARISCTRWGTASRANRMVERGGRQFFLLLDSADHR
jgi:hypothetical protein